MEPSGAGWDGVYWVDLAQERDRYSLVSLLMAELVGLLDRH